MTEINSTGGRFEYEIVKRKRKSIGISISREGKVVVTAPNYVEDQIIREIVQKKSNWILSKLKVVKENNQEMGTMGYVNGDVIPYLGSNYTLEIVEKASARSIVELDNNSIRVVIKGGLEEDKRINSIKLALKKWYREQALIVFRERTNLYSRMLNLYPTNIKIKDQKTLWGSCSGKNNINYNWRLVMAPLEILDYIVVHELCHLRHRNHSKVFWELVEEVIPDYQLKRKWLKEKGAYLMAKFY